MKLFIRKTFSFLLDTLFPKFCVNCGEEGNYICKKCSLFISEANFVCPTCQKASYFGKRHKNCRKLNEPDGLISVWDYDGPIKKAVHCIKYQGFFDISKEIIKRAIIEFEKDKKRFSQFLFFLFDKETSITFVPTNPSSERRKGFDHSKILADQIAKATNKKTVNFLEKIREVKSQTGLDKKERFLNVKNSFSFIPSSEGKEIEKVIIVDDVWTSGATMKECCRILKNNGVKKVWGFTITKA